MNITLLAADIAARVPEMAKDSAINNADVIQRMIQAEMGRGENESYEVRRARANQRLLEALESKQS